MNASLQPILTDLRTRLESLCRQRLHRLILFGSRARGDEDPESDIDILIVLADDSAIEDHRTGITDIVHELCLDYDTVISCVFTTPEKVDRSGMPFYRNVRREGVAL